MFLPSVERSTANSGPPLSSGKLVLSMNGQTYPAVVPLVSAYGNIDTWEVIEAAKTKPFGFMPFYPGPGIGGHCLPIDPLYLSWKSRRHGFEARMIELASSINKSMPAYVVDRVRALIEEAGLSVKPPCPTR